MGLTKFPNRRTRSLLVDERGDAAEDSLSLSVSVLKRGGQSASQSVSSSASQSARSPKAYRIHRIGPPVLPLVCRSVGQSGRRGNLPIGRQPDRLISNTR
eukprot:Selendium_serpulae@DN6031_c1_g1_i1.p1